MKRNFQYFRGHTNTLLGEKLLQLDTILPSGRIYPKNELIKLRSFGPWKCSELDKLNYNSPLFGQIGFGEDTITIGYGSHYTKNFKIVNKWLIGDITILDESLFNNLEDYIFRPRSIGTVNHDFIVDLAEIITFDAIRKDEYGRMF